MKRINGITTALCILIALFSYLGWCFLTISYRGIFFLYLFVFINCLVTLGYTAVFLYIRSYPIYFRQLNKVNGLIFVLFSLVTARTAKNLFAEGSYEILEIQILWLIVSAALLIVNLFSHHKGIYRIDRREVLQYRYIALLLVIVGILCVINASDQFKWDGLLYYKTIQTTSFYSLSSMAVYGHISQTYGFIMSIFSTLIGNTATAMLFANIALLLSSIFFFYLLIKKILPKETEIIYLGGAAIYAFSPFFLGMVNYHNPDFVLQCLLPIVFYYTIEKKWIYQFFAALLFCFTKEPAVIIYAALCLGVALKEMMSYECKRIGGVLKRVFMTKEYYVMIIPCILWLITYKLLGPWSAGNGAFKLSISYVLEKLKVLYILNFNWVFLAIEIIGIMLALKGNRKLRGSYRMILPVFFIQLLFTAFSCMFETVNHPRYSDSNMFCLYLIAVVTIICCLQEFIKKSTLYILTGFMLVSSFYTIDIISLSVFPNINVGNEKMLFTQSPGYGDGMIYNRQMLKMEYALNLALANAVEQNSIICMPALCDSTYFFDGMSEVAYVNGTYFKQLLYWDNKLKKRYTEPNKNRVEIEIYEVSENIDWKAFMEENGNSKITYIYMDNGGENAALRLKECLKSTGEKTFSHKGWEVKSITTE